MDHPKPRRASLLGQREFGVSSVVGGADDARLIIIRG
jgi:hypothetical protein